MPKLRKQTNTPSQKQKGEASKTPLQKQATPVTPSQKGSESSESKPAKNSTMFSDNIFKHDDMKTFIFPCADSKYKFFCDYCYKKTGQKKNINVDYLRGHVTSDVHELNVPKEKRKEHQEIIAMYAKKDAEDAAKKGENSFASPADKKKFQDYKKYIEFLAFAMSENYTFAQISRLGKFIKNMQAKNGLNFFRTCNFEEEEVSRLSSECFQPYYLKQLRQEIASKPYSLIIDSSTVCGQNLFAMKVKYLSTEKDENNKSRTTIQNKFIGLQAFSESSTGHVMNEILQKKLFNDNEDIKKNIIGVTHDFAKNLIGPKIGLVSSLKQINKDLFDLNDPCHGLNLTAVNSMKALPSDFKTFVEKLHSYFTHPQRQARLTNIQIDQKLIIKKLKKYAKTRWLSFGKSLERIIDIWESLKLYMDIMDKKIKKKDEKVDDESLDKIDYKWFLNLLNDDCFFFQINFLAHIIGKINYFNTKFQSHSLEIQNLRTLTIECYKTMLKLIIPSNKVTSENIDKFLRMNWHNDENKKEWLMNLKEFISSTSELPKCHRIKYLTHKDQETCYKIFTDFLIQVFDILPEYLPLEDKSVSLLDFIELRGEFATNEQKILDLNKLLQFIQDSDEIEELKLELTRLSGLSPGDYRREAKNSLHMWDLIEQDNFDYLPKIARMAQTLPTSSASLEQTFSIVKLIKGEKRYRLSEANLEGQLFVQQEFKGKTIVIPDEIVDLFYTMKGELNTRKTNSPNKEENNSEEQKNSDDKIGHLEVIGVETAAPAEKGKGKGKKRRANDPPNAVKDDKVSHVTVRQKNVEHGAQEKEDGE